MLKCTIVAGVNGTGKSSLLGAAQNLRTDLGLMMDDTVEQVKFITEKVGGVIGRGVDFTIETTLDGDHIEAILRKAAREGYQVRLHYVGLDTLEECVGRVDGRADRGGRMVPEKLIAKRFETRCEDLQRVLPYCSEVVFWDNTEQFRVVAEYRNGSFLYKGDRPPKWAQEFHQALWWKEEPQQ